MRAHRLDLAALSRKVQGLVVTLGAQGAKQVWVDGAGRKWRRWRPQIVDPTGCGDAWRGACSLAWSRVGPWSAALHWAIAWVLSKSQRVDHRTTHWISIPHRWAPDSTFKSTAMTLSVSLAVPAALPALLPSRWIEKRNEGTGIKTRCTAPELDTQPGLRIRAWSLWGTAMLPGVERGLCCPGESWVAAGFLAGAAFFGAGAALSWLRVQRLWQGSLLQ